MQLLIINYFFNNITGFLFIFVHNRYKCFYSCFGYSISYIKHNYRYLEIITFTSSFEICGGYAKSHGRCTVYFTNKSEKISAGEIEGSCIFLRNRFTVTCIISFATSSSLTIYSPVCSSCLLKSATSNKVAL